MATGKKKKKPKLQKWNDCNLIQFRESEARLWHFAVSEKQVTQKSQLTHSESTPLPQTQVEQAWRQFFKKRLNLSWIPSEHLYLRVIDMPACEDREETRQMLEFQLEKISPVPVHQIVWSFQNLPCPDPEQQSLLLVLAERSAVDGVLSQLESIGYQTDQITFSGLQGLVGFESPSDCVRISWEPRDEHSADCLISWHIDGWTKDAGLVHVPMDERGAQALVNHLNNAAWSGELEGWLKQAPEVRFEGPEEEPGSWIEAAKKWSSLGVEHEDAPHSEVRAQECAERSGTRKVDGEPHAGGRSSWISSELCGRSLVEQPQRGWAYLHFCRWHLLRCHGVEENRKPGPAGCHEEPRQRLYQHHGTTGKSQHPPGAGGFEILSPGFTENDFGAHARWDVPPFVQFSPR